MNIKTKNLIKHIKILYESGYNRKEIAYILCTSYTNVCNYLNNNYLEERKFEKKIEKCRKQAEKVLEYLKKEDRNITSEVEGSILLFLTIEFLDRE